MQCPRLPTLTNKTLQLLICYCSHDNHPQYIYLGMDHQMFPRYSPEISFLDVAVYQKNSNAVTSFIVKSAVVLTTAMAGILYGRLLIKILITTEDGSTYSQAEV